jgi:hypothetical protein
MHRYMNRYSPAPLSLVEAASSMFPYREMSAEEYAAREAHNWACFSFGQYIYEDASLNDWIHTLDDIFFTPGRLGEVQRKYLTPHEIEEIDRASREPF